MGQNQNFVNQKKFADQSEEREKAEEMTQGRQGLWRKRTLNSPLFSHSTTSYFACCIYPKFLGGWYVIQKFSTASSCWIYDFNGNNSDHSLKIVQSRNHVALDTIGLDNNYRYTGALDVPDSNQPGFMCVRFPMIKLGILLTIKVWQARLIICSIRNGLRKLWSYLYSCQSILFGHRRSASILSRRPTLDQPQINKIRSKLESFGVNPHDFSIIDHLDCKLLPSISLLNVEVNPHTFSRGERTQTEQKTYFSHK
ncbi:uncharacterized protein LOC124188294 isoform X2 [Daphnia pulex]|uniref:uncharacterized protein LOC124188294 isoform X2 n=1 Tax=Daphnia pulex TaxID=6669 RepID=UPI001EDFB91E|nr:uncharacterized protein LOC124188294 isoform X2 [Daphnia pulex]